MALFSAANNTGKAMAVPDSSSFIICYTPTMLTTNGFWQGDNLLDFSIPLFVLQAIFVIVFTRGLHLVFRRFRQPRFVAEVIGGVIIGPSVMGKIPDYMDVLFPTRSVVILESLASIGLVYFLFLVGLQVDIGSVNRGDGKRAWVITGAGVVLPFIIEIVGFLMFGGSIARNSHPDSFLIFLGVSLSITAYPVLARILAELKLLSTDIGKLAMSTAILNDGLAWVLLAIAIALSGKHRSLVASLGIIVSGLVFIVVVYYTVRPGAKWIASHINEGEALDEVYVVMVLVAVLTCGVFADMIGIHAVFGAFVMGAVIPNGPLSAVMIEKLEDFVSGLLLPLFFAVIGLRVDIASITDPGVYGFLVGVIVLSAVAKVGMTVLVSMFYAMPARDGLSLGILMNTKGLMELIVLHIALDKKVLYTQSYSIMILMSVLMTALVSPLATLVHRPSRQLIGYKRRMLRGARPDSELRMLVCIHTTRNVSSTVSLLDISNPTKRSPIFVYTVHLVELTGRESAMLIVHDNNDGSGKRLPGAAAGGGKGNLNRIKAQSDQIIKAFENYEQHAGGVSIQPLTAVSAYGTMHEDVCNLAEEKRAALMILPFHKQHTVDGGMEVTNPGIRTFNQNVLANGPCSVAILVDRGLGSARKISTTCNVTLLFIGGPDDREAIAYASRMADNPGVNLMVLRFIDSNQPPPRSLPPGTNLRDHRLLSSLPEEDRERLLDDDCIKEFRMKTMNYDSVIYEEKTVANGEETVTTIRSMGTNQDLFIVGRGEGSENSLMAGLTDWTESPELGPVGDMLASSDFTATVSVLVVQQYKGGGPGADSAPDSPMGGGNPVQQYLNRANLKDRSSGWGP